MTFYTFMMRNHRGKDTPQGDLADDMFRDREKFPRNGKGKYEGWHTVLRRYLEAKQACRDCLEVFEGCWKDYVKCEKR